jgi:putative endonuclease
MVVRVRRVTIRILRSSNRYNSSFFLTVMLRWKWAASSVVIAAIQVAMTHKWLLCYGGEGEVRMRTGYVYITASKRNGTLYIGVTNNLVERITQHREGRGSAFAKKYGVTQLVWFEEFALVTDAIQRETSLKRWPRKWKIALIEKHNPDWQDLYYGLF